MFIDYIEIGTCDRDTEVQKKDDRKGISIEPIKYYLDRLPDKKNNIKLNIAISNYTGEGLIHYISKENIIKYDLPPYFTGCNKLNNYHHLALQQCNIKKINIEELIIKEKIKVDTLMNVILQNNISGLFFLKIDTEGQDCIILKKYYNDIKTNKYLPYEILFETNSSSKKRDINEIINIYTIIGYDLIYKKNNTLLKLNLNKLKKEKIFTDELNSYFIQQIYPDNYNITNLPHENTLESAKQYCIDNNCTGITLCNDIYEVRKGDYVIYDNKNISKSWIYL